MTRNAKLAAIASICALAALAQGCATCRRHPDGCAIAGTVAAGLVIGGLAASEWHGGGCIAGCRPMPLARDPAQVPTAR